MAASAAVAGVATAAGAVAALVAAGAGAAAGAVAEAAAAAAAAAGGGMGWAAQGTRTEPISAAPRIARAAASSLSHGGQRRWGSGGCRAAVGLRCTRGRPSAGTDERPMRSPRHSVVRRAQVYYVVDDAAGTGTIYGR